MFRPEVMMTETLHVVLGSTREQRRVRLGCFLSCVLLVASMAPPTVAQIDPRAPGAIALPEIGRLTGSLKCVTGVDERFGRQVYPLGDVGGDGLNDWILTHRRCDTSFSGKAVVELLIYHGVRGGLPPASAGIRLGPSEIDADCSFIGAGDYDGDGHRDVAISQRILSDPFVGGSYTSSIVIYWNDRTGRFATSDTTHLTAPNQRICIAYPDDVHWVLKPERSDLDLDGIDDLVIATFAWQTIDRVYSTAANLLAYRGGSGTRWGRNGVPTQPDWQLWQRHFTRRVSVLDHDGDGVLDIAMYIDSDAIGTRGGISVLYGKRGALPDTIPQSIDFVRVGGYDGKQGQLIDVTGDGVPELVVSTGDTVDGFSQAWLIYVGRRGQRLNEQYGSGNDAPRPGDSLWWGRPRTEVWTPNRLSPGWSNPTYSILDPGDIGLDGVGDVCAASYPDIICYNGGAMLDSYIDAWMSIWPADGATSRNRIVRLGDVDGSGRPAIGVGLSGGGVAFVRSDPLVPRGGTPIRLPEGTDRPVSAPLRLVDQAEPQLTVMPNPASTHTRVHFSESGGGVVIALLDLRGRGLRRWLLPAGQQELTIALAGMPAGLYIVSMASGGRMVCIPLMHIE
jgi:hypothetical protein